ncbi:Hypothetical protein PHPALM_13924 [Phytophthora palmivora]|uniref:Carbohydrate-binding protein n=1 Tax=Phytophthora palmivora TaxID=4796 RepID=A0A2P4XW18_9STRA|nr:Hypothetical protein PHPALM_13924 [Phytophthora palmivora]
MWPKLAVATALLVIQSAAANDCAYTVSVLDVAGVQCVSSAPCSGTYYASGLSQGVGACPTGTSCALLPETPIMGCASSGRTDLIYVNADGTLTKDGKSVTLSGASSTNSDSTTAPNTSSSSKSTSSTSSSSKSTSSSSTANSSNGSTSSNDSNGNSSSGSTANSGSDGNVFSATSSNKVINSGTVIAGGSDTSNATDSNSTSASASNYSSSASHSWKSDSGSGSNITIPRGSSSANQQSFNPGSILSDSSKKQNPSGNGGLGIGTIICIVVACLAVVAVAAGARLLRKGKEAELATPDAVGAGAMEGYNNGGGGGGMTPKENVLLL